MKKIKDNFSKQANLYRKFRPHYPSDFLAEIRSLVDHSSVLWDCATGNGQVAMAMAPFFDQVFASDFSAKQLENAPQHARISYSVQQAEKTNYESKLFDLITVGQAMHWFDFKTFYHEARRVAKPDAILAIWGYGLLRIQPEIDALIDHYYTQIIGPYWDEERKHVDDAYASIAFPFEEIKLGRAYAIEVRWTRDQLEGYLNTWSSLQKYKQAHPDKSNPVDKLMEGIHIHWKEKEEKDIRFPLFTKIGRIR